MKILEQFYRDYWQFGFTTRLYDNLCPAAYHESVKAAADQVIVRGRAAVLDLGCGSGLLLHYLEEALRGGLRYIGTDRLASGLMVTRRKAERLPQESRVHVFRSDMTRDWPLKEEGFDYVVAHFSIYTLNRAEDRAHVYRHIARVLKPGGRAVVSNPSVGYNAHRIIKESVKVQKGSVPVPLLRMRRYLLYPLTLALGLRHIQAQLEAGVWHAYTRDGFCAEVESAGLQVEVIQPVYAGSGYLVVARKI